ncbi:MAG: hypothetical protein JW768_01000 [Chitinispirillaceae bacterium]|nr:hypothetical protein [Chitinispirillaceae bacterium]
MPRPTFSTARLDEIASRACRLCCQVGNGAEVFGSRIAAAQDVLEQKRRTAETKKFERILAYDAAILSNSTLDDAVRTAHGECEKYERNNDFVPVVQRAFPGGTITPIIQAPREKKHVLVQQVVSCLHEIASQDGGQVADIASVLDTALQASLKADSFLEQKTLESEGAEALEKLGRIEFCDSYSGVYHDACREFGRRRANRLFPVLNNGTKAAAKDQDTPETAMDATA